VRVVLAEGGPRILPTFPERISARAARDLARLGVEIRTGSRVTGIDALGARIGEEAIPARTTFWAAGNKASSLGQSLGVALDPAGRVLVEPDLRLREYPEVMVIGDLAKLPYPP
jgi:NADH dehydrogenase